MNRDDVKAEWKRATETLGATMTLASSGYNNDAISRSYYAMLHAAKAGLATKDIETDTHRGVAAMFGKHLVKTGEVGAEQGQEPETGRRRTAGCRLPGSTRVYERPELQGMRARARLPHDGARASEESRSTRRRTGGGAGPAGRRNTGKGQDRSAGRDRQTQRANRRPAKRAGTRPRRGQDPSFEGAHQQRLEQGLNAACSQT